MATTTDKLIHYSVNGEGQSTTERKLTVRRILESAGFAPADQYELTRDKGNHKFKSLEEEESIHEAERYTATFRGPTPVSWR